MWSILNPMSSFSHRPGPASGGAQAQHFGVSAQCENSPSQQGALNGRARNGFQRPAGLRGQSLPTLKTDEAKTGRGQASAQPASRRANLGAKPGFSPFRIEMEKERKI